MAAEARSRHERDAGDLQLQGSRVDGHVEQGVPHLAARSEVAWRRRPSDAALSNAAAVQRRSGFRRGRHLGKHGDVGRRARHALDSDADLGAAALGIQGAGVAWTGHARRDRRAEARREEWRAGADARLDVARHGSRRAAGHRERRHLYLRQRRRRDAGDGRGRPQLERAAPHPVVEEGRALRARCADGPGALFERTPRSRR